MLGSMVILVVLVGLIIGLVFFVRCLLGGWWTSYCFRCPYDRSGRLFVVLFVLLVDRVCFCRPCFLRLFGSG